MTRSKHRNKWFYLVVGVILLYGLVQEQGISLPGFGSPSQAPENALQVAFDNKQSDLQVQGQGIVAKVLPDDREGSRHQRFILEIDGGPSVLVAHNIDLAPRIDGLKKGDLVEFFGEYEWTAKGGVIHWTHHDPGKRHVDGWLRHQGKTYQ